MSFTRIIEFLIIDHYSIYDVSWSFLFQLSINLDAFFGIALSIALLIPFAFISLINERLSLMFYKLIWLFIILITILLTHFFVSSGFLLTNILFQFSFSEICHIVAIESGNKHFFIWVLYLIIPLSIFIYWFFATKIKINKKKSAILIGLYCILVLFVGINYKHYYKPSDKFNKQFEFYLSNNKIVHFSRSIINANLQHDDFHPKRLYAAIENYQNTFSNFNFISTAYPLMHNESYSNVLGKYFKVSNQPPNIVIIISEGLASSFAGMHPTTVHLMPFVDSLAKQGLYWENFLSNCCRTYGVLPNVLGSLPSGTKERGFTNFDGNDVFGKRYPEHNSLIKELENNNYFTSFYYGGWGAFDNYQFFIEDQKTDLILEQSGFDSIKYMPPWKRKPKGTYWGYDDKALFSQWFDAANQKKITQPYLSIFLTLNMHEPYNICPASYYDSLFIHERLKKLKLENSAFSKKDNETLGSLFFYEDALKEFFENFKKRSDYYSTIFLIFGDHYSVMAFLNNPLEIYHVPFIIYSPLIKESTVFKGVSTHLDITPSIIALLQGNFNLKFNENKHWIGQGLDTSKTFNCNRIAPFNMYNSDYPLFLYKNYLITQNAQFKIYEGLKAERVKDSSLDNKAIKFMNDYEVIDNYVCKKDKIWKK